MAEFSAEDLRKDLLAAEKEREQFLKWVKRVDAIYDGDYTALGDDDKIRPRPMRVRTDLMYDTANRNVAMLMPPPNLKFIGIPTGKNQQPDKDSAKTAKALSEYFWHHGKCYDKIQEALLDYTLHDRCLVREGYRPDLDAEAIISASFENDGDVADTARPSDGEEKMAGHPFFDVVKSRHFLKAPGFRSIEEAWAEGGWIAVRFDPHIEWVRKNEDYIEKARGEIKADIKYKWDDPKPERQRYSADMDAEAQYCILYEIFRGPTLDQPDGFYIIFSKEQDLILYEAPGMPYKGIKYPVKELIKTKPREGYYSKSAAHRACNALLDHEWYESLIMNRHKQAKVIIFVNESAKEAAKEALRLSDYAVVMSGDNLQPGDVIVQVLPIDTTSAEAASLRAKARFEDLMGVNLSGAKLGQKIATEMVINKRDDTIIMNHQKIKTHRFIQDIMMDEITIAKQKMPPEKQIEITRSADMVWEDHESVTLEGNFAIMLKVKPILDMTEGERANTLISFMGMLSRLELNPKYSERIDVLDLTRDVAEIFGISTHNVIKEIKQKTQFYEISLIQADIKAPVEPDDDHVGHLRDMKEWSMILEQAGGDLEDDINQALQQHAAGHVEYIKLQSKGAAKGMGMANEDKGVNETNIGREAGAAPAGGVGNFGIPGLG